VYLFTLRTYSVVAVLADGVCVSETFISEQPLVNGEPPSTIVRGVLEKESPGDKWHAVQPPFESDYAMQSRNDSLTVLLKYRAPKLKAIRCWTMQVGQTWAVTVTNNKQPRVAPAPQPAPAPEVNFEPIDSTRPPADCAIVAAQAYARLKPVTYWCQIVGVDWIWPTGKSSGHAMVFYKYQADGNVFVYDENGALELDTTGQDLAALKVALQTKTSHRSVQALRYLTH
jgi:hypothetical protein